MILRQFVTGSNSVEEIYIVKSNHSNLLCETNDNGRESCKIHDAAEQCVLANIDKTTNINRKTESDIIKPRQRCFNVDAKMDLERNTEKLRSERQKRAPCQYQLTSDKHFCHLCLEEFNTIVMLKQHLTVNHHHLLPFRCNSCASREIRSVLLLNKHFSQHDRNKLYKCSYCEARFDNTTHRSVHQRRFHEEELANHTYHDGVNTTAGRYTCRYCEKRFVAKANFDRHERNHEKILAVSGEVDVFNYLYYCYVCSKQFTSKQTLNDHLHVHVDRLPYRCDQCVSTKVIILSVRLLNKHVALHLEKKPIKCIYCAETFVSIQECEEHERLSHVELKSKAIRRSSTENDDENETTVCKRSIVKNHTNRMIRYECSYCNKSYSLLSTLRRHENVHTGSRQFICKICGKIFKKSSCLSQHERTHLEEFPYKCSYCGKGFKETIRLIEHRRIHTGEKPFQCDYCTMRFRLKPLLKEHTVKCANKKIGPAKDVRCEQCGRVFPCTQLLINHIMESHSQHMSVDGKCKYCDMKFKSSTALLEHEQQHRHPGAIECKHCGRIFKQRANLRRHQKLHTMNAMPYQCDLCEKSFSQLSTMKVHKRVHTGEKPYKCERCGKNFQHSSTKKRHERSHNK